MAKLVDAMDLIGLSLGIETYQVITFKFRGSLELKMGNPKPNSVVWKKSHPQTPEVALCHPFLFFSFFYSFFFFEFMEYFLSSEQKYIYIFMANNFW